MSPIARFLSAAALVGVLPLLLPTESAAQYGRAVHSMVKLTSTDRAIIRKIVREEFTGKPNGTTMPWSNPESGNSGTVTLLDRFDSQHRDCRRVKYFIKPGPTQPATVIPATYVLTTCRLPDGSWKLDKQAKRDTP